MSVTTRFKRTTIHLKGAALSLVHHGLLLIGLLLGLASLPALANDNEVREQQTTQLVQAPAESAGDDAPAHAATALSPRMQKAFDYV